jgi:cytochrome oxidase Cu insertion factor (SCO1/SenC/PrrC family)
MMKPVCFARIAVAAALLACLSEGEIHAEQLGWITPGPRLPNVELLDHDGQKVRLDEAIGGRVVVVSFFFAGCVNICPPQTAILQQVKDHLQHASGGSEGPLIVSISVDPTPPSQVRSYAEQFGIQLGSRNGWLMLTGSFEGLLRASAAFEELGSRPQDHTGTIWVGNPKQGRWVRIPFSSHEATSAPAIAALVQEVTK